QLVVAPRLATITAEKVSARKARPLPAGVAQYSYLQFRTSIGKSIILGDPGGGKSTLTQLLCFDNSNSIILEAPLPGNPKFGPAELRLTFRIILRSYEKRRNSRPGYSFFDYLVDEAKDIFEGDESYCRRVLKQMMALGQCVLIFDGLDEI